MIRWHCLGKQTGRYECLAIQLHPLSIDATVRKLKIFRISLPDNVRRISRSVDILVEEFVTAALDESAILFAPSYASPRIAPAVILYCDVPRIVHDRPICRVAPDMGGSIGRDVDVPG